jgi:hypothetical protein
MELAAAQPRQPQGTNDLAVRFATFNRKEPVVNCGIYIVGLVAIVIAILSFFVLR